MLPNPPVLAPISVGPVRIACPVVLAPMTGVTDMPFRKIVRRFGSGLNVTEMIASPAAIRETRQSIQKAAWDPAEEPVSMQLVGCTPHEMAMNDRLMLAALRRRGYNDDIGCAGVVLILLGATVALPFVSEALGRAVGFDLATPLAVPLWFALAYGGFCARWLWKWARSP